MNRVFKWLTEEGNNPRAGTYTSWFAKSFEPKDFQGIDRLLVCYIKYCAKLYITPRKEFLGAYLKIDGKQDIRKYNIKTDTMSSYDYSESSQLEEAYQVISSLAHTAYDSYISEDISNREFKVDMYDFMSSMKSDMIQQEMMRAYPRLTDGSNITEVSEDLRSSLAKLDEVYDTRKIKDVDSPDEHEEDEGEMHFLAKTQLPCVDGDIGGIYTRIIYTLNAQPGGGKTRMALIHWVYQVLTVAKKDVVFYETELSAAQVKNILIAYHITRVYGGRIKIPDSLMNKKREMNEQQLQIYESAKIDLFESGNYGKFILREDCVVEKLEDELTIDIRENNVGLIGIDYMGLIESRPESKWDKTLEQFEIITEAYKIVRRIVRRLDVSGICINQYNDKGIEAAYAGKTIRSGHVQGGHIVQRHTDYDLSMTYTEEQKLAKVRSLSTSKVRGTAGFANVLFRTDLSVSIFLQELSK